MTRWADGLSVETCTAIGADARRKAPPLNTSPCWWHFPDDETSSDAMSTLFDTSAEAEEAATLVSITHDVVIAVSHYRSGGYALVDLFGDDDTLRLVASAHADRTWRVVALVASDPCTRHAVVVDTRTTSDDVAVMLSNVLGALGAVAR